MTAKLVFDILV